MPRRFSILAGGCMFSGKRLLITGGTGSFGNAVLRRFLDTDIAEIRVFSRDEKKQHDMRHAYTSKKLKFFLGDVRAPESIRDAMHNVDYVFHAAALKHVPSCESFPLEAVRTNVLGAENVITAAIEAGVRRLVVLSTDKAVYPISAMGMTKALMEKIAIARASSAAERGCTLCITRYGNVMASRGSVIQLFVDQIQKGMPLTVTDPTMSRFMMSLDDSVDLVVHAFRLARPGDLFVHKAPAVTIGVLAEAMKRVFAVDNAIHVVGQRPGEKQFETLVTGEEMGRAVDFGAYYRVSADTMETSMRSANAVTGDGYRSDLVRMLEVEEMVEMLMRLPYIGQQLTTCPLPKIITDACPVTAHEFA